MTQTKRTGIFMFSLTWRGEDVISSFPAFLDSSCQTPLGRAPLFIQCHAQDGNQDYAHITWIVCVWFFYYWCLCKKKCFYLWNTLLWFLVFSAATPHMSVLCVLYPPVIMLSCYQVRLWVSCEMMWQLSSCTLTVWHVWAVSTETNVFFVVVVVVVISWILQS